MAEEAFLSWFPGDFSPLSHHLVSVASGSPAEKAHFCACLPSLTWCIYGVCIAFPSAVSSEATTTVHRLGLLWLGPVPLQPPHSLSWLAILGCDFVL